MVSCKTSLGTQEKEVLKKLSLESEEAVKFRKRQTITYIMWFVIEILFGISAFSRNKLISILFLTCGMIFLVLVLTMKTAHGRQIMKSIEKNHEGKMSAEREYIFDEEGVQINSVFGTGKNLWNSFTGWKELDGYICVMSVDNRCFLVKKENLSVEKQQELIRLLLTNIGKVNS